MDDSRFDSLALSLTDARSRRAILGGLLAGALGLLGVRSEEAAAHNPLKACKKKSGDAKKKCLKKAKKHNARHASETTVPPPPPPPFCETGTGDCQASGPRCLCARSASGTQVCVTHASWRENVFHCGACTGPGEICVNPNAAHDFAACAVPCANPR